MTKIDRKRLSSDAPVAVVCLLIHFVAQAMSGYPLSRTTTAQLEKVQRWNREALQAFGIIDQKSSRQIADAIHTAYAELAKKLSPRFEALPERLF